MKKIVYIMIIALIFIMFMSININTYATTHTTGEVIVEADNFINKGESGSTKIFSEEDLRALSNTIYNILLVVGIVIAVLLGAILGIKFMMEGAEGKAEVKKALIPYVIGCVVIFGAFTIWKIVVSVLQGLE